jgi:hypothetical protein
MATEALPTIDQLSNFFTANGVTTRCTQCGAEDWVLVEAPQSAAWSISAARVDGTVVMAAPSIPLVALCCSKCANLRQHALRPIQHWINANSSQAGAGHE